MEGNKVINRANALLGYDNVSVEIKTMNFEASIIVKHMGDAFVINFNDKSKKLILDTCGYTKEKDFLDGLKCSNDAIMYNDGLDKEDMESKRIIIFDDPLKFERVSNEFDKNMIALFILLSEDDEAGWYYPLLKFEESKIYGRKFVFNMP